ncbi:MAG: hypothetical protein ABJN38_10750 [Lentilitoribacter sp.]
MRRAFLIFIFNFLVSGIAQAEPIVVRSGEHDNFTRLVLPLPLGSRWSIDERPGVAKVILEEFNDGFDLSYAFEIIPRTRLVALVARGSELELQLSCTCPVVAFIEDGNFLVVDIADGEDIKNASSPSILSSNLPDTSFSHGDLLWADNAQTVSPSNLNNPLEEPPTVDVDQKTDTKELSTEIILETQNRLLQALSIAASKGLVAPKQNLPISPPVASDMEFHDNVEIFDSSELPDMAPKQHIRISNSKDVPKNGTLENMAMSGETCPDPKIVNVVSWGQSSDFTVEIGQSNLQLHDDLGRLKEVEVLKRARLYIFFGFGAEAREMLNLIPGIEDEHPELTELAGIMEYGYAKESNFLTKFTGCSSDLALWGVLANQNLPLDQDIDASAALRALQKLPAHLKFFVAQQLGSQFLKRGDIANANIAIRSYEALKENAASKPSIIHAQMSELESKSETPSQIYKEIIEEDTNEAPDALISLIKKNVQNGIDIPADLALLAESYSFEFKNSTRSPEFFQASVLALAKSAQFTKAFEALSDSKRISELNGSDQNQLTSYVFSELTQASEDIDFLNGFFTQFPSHVRHVSSKVKLSIANRLMQIGFIEQASNLISNLPTGFQSDELRVAKSRILFASGQYHESLETIEGMEGNQVKSLRGEILQKLGQNNAAANAFDAANLQDQALSSRWLADDWSDLVSETTPVFGELAKLSNENAIEVTRNQNMLERTAEAIASSESARSVLGSVLDQLANSNR